MPVIPSCLTVHGDPRVVDERSQIQPPIRVPLQAHIYKVYAVRMQLLPVLPLYLGELLDLFLGGEGAVAAEEHKRQAADRPDAGGERFVATLSDEEESYNWVDFKVVMLYFR